MGKPEAKIEDALVRRIEAIGGLIRKTAYIGRRGCPDRRAMLPRAWRVHLALILGDVAQNPWIEVKRPGGSLEAHQVREHARMDEFGEMVLVIDCLEDIDTYFPVSLRGH